MLNSSKNMTSKLTPEARTRCAAHTLAEQLEQLRQMHAVETLRLKISQAHDMKEIDQMLEADMSWSGNHARLARLVLPIGGAD